jgi:hypothetical protein
MYEKGGYMHMKRRIHVRETMSEYTGQRTSRDWILMNTQIQSLPLSLSFSLSLSLSLSLSPQNGNRGERGWQETNNMCASEDRILSGRLEYFSGFPRACAIFFFWQETNNMFAHIGRQEIQRLVEYVDRY